MKCFFSIYLFSVRLTACELPVFYRRTVPYSIFCQAFSLIILNFHISDQMAIRNSKFHVLILATEMVVERRWLSWSRSQPKCQFIPFGHEKVPISKFQVLKSTAPRRFTFFLFLYNRSICRFIAFADRSTYLAT